MTTLFLIVYNLLVLPVLILVLHIVGLFNSKTRRGVTGRYKSIEAVSTFRDSIPVNTQTFLMHCASLGEFEHIRPILKELKQTFPAGKTVVMFFSPSGYENHPETSDVDLFVYSPFDDVFSNHRFFKALKPSALLIARYDVWPGQVFQASKMGIPTALVNASIYEKSRRLNPFYRWMQSIIYKRLSVILAISEEDAKRFALLAHPSAIKVTGDTKYEQVLFRRDERLKTDIIPSQILKDKLIFVAGSSWPEDEACFLPTVQSQSNPDLLTVICPHEPTELHLSQLEEKLGKHISIRLSNIESWQAESAILIDRIGILANLYRIADIAFVGGGFKQNVHNVLEPAAYEIPVLFGPVNINSREAQLLKASQGGIEIRDADHFHRVFHDLLQSKQKRKAQGKAAYAIIARNQGATRATVETISQLIGT